MRENGFKLCQGRFRFGIITKIFIKRVIREGLLEVVESLFLKMLEKSAAVEWLSGEDNSNELTLGPNDFKYPFQPQQFYDSMKSPNMLS